MRNTGILLFLVGVYLVLNSGSFRDVILGKADISFLNPKGSNSDKSSGRVRSGSWDDDENDSDSISKKVGRIGR